MLYPIIFIVSTFFVLASNATQNTSSINPNISYITLSQNSVDPLTKIMAFIQNGTNPNQCFKTVRNNIIIPICQAIQNANFPANIDLMHIEKLHKKGSDLAYGHLPSIKHGVYNKYGNYVLCKGILHANRHNMLLAKLLMQYGTHPNELNYKDNSVLHAAMKLSYNVNILKEYTQRNNLKIDIPNKKGDTPLMTLARKCHYYDGNLNILELKFNLLLSCKADLQKTNQYNITAQQIAESQIKIFEQPSGVTHSYSWL